jgi:hypothetical protein
LIYVLLVVAVVLVWIMVVEEVLVDLELQQ